MAKDIKIGSFRAPYNFVPLNKDVFGSEGTISQDIPFLDGEDGVVRLEIKNLTPMLIGGTKDGNDVFSVRACDDRYFIPATSLKGMIRSVLEIMSFGKMKQYDKDFFAFRDVANRDKSLGYSEKMDDVRSGWLCAEGDTYKLYPCKYDKIAISDVKRQFRCYVQGNDAFKKADKFYENNLGYYPDVEGMKLVCTGDISGKMHEYLFSAKAGIGEKVDNDVIKKFLSVYKSSKAYGKVGNNFKLKERLASGIDIPVFYHCDETGNVATIGISRMYRYPFAKGVEQAAKQNPCKGLDMAERIFGYISKEDSLKGRVLFGHAFAKSAIGQNEIVTKPVVLGSPQASYYPLYLKQAQSNRKYVTYNSNEPEIAGRKRYTIMQNMVADEKMPHGNGNENVGSQLHMLPSNIDFEGKIIVHNLKKEELGALLAAITFYGQRELHHNIGMGKALGMGKLNVEVRLDGFKYSEMEYMNTFVQKMDDYTKAKYNKSWKDTEQITTLFALAQEHPNGMEDCYMSLDEYKHYKDGKNFTVRPNESYKIQQSPFDIHAEVISRARLLAKDGNYDALNELKKIKGDFWKSNDKLEFENLEKEIRQSLENSVQKPTEVVSTDLTPELSIADFLASFKVSSIAAFAARLKKRKEIAESDWQLITEKLRNEIPTLKKAVQKDWQEFSKWKPIVDVIDETKAKKLYDSVF